MNQFVDKSAITGYNFALVDLLLCCFLRQGGVFQRHFLETDCDVGKEVEDGRVSHKNEARRWGPGDDAVVRVKPSPKLCTHGQASILCCLSSPNLFPKPL